MRVTVKSLIKAMRELDQAGEPITSAALVESLKISDTERSTAMDVAAGWISTLRRYGFLLPSRGEKVDGPQRKLQVYRLTDWGRRYKVKASQARERHELKIAANPKKGE